MGKKLNVIQVCPVCGVEFKQLDYVGNLFICRSCGQSGSKFQRELSFLQRKRRLIFITGITACLGVAGYLYLPDILSDETSEVRYLKRNWDRMQEEELFVWKEKCLRNGNVKCQSLVYKKLLENEPTNVVYKANYAFCLTDLKEHKEAIKLYIEILGSGEGTYDLMAYYATSLKAIGEWDEAAKWFLNALQISPNLIDATQELSAVLVKLGRRWEAASLLNSFMQRFPESEGTLSGSLLAIRESLGAPNLDLDAPIMNIDLLALRGGHHFVPLRFSENGKPGMFMVDSGASLTTMPTEYLRQVLPMIVGSGTMVQVRLADGRTEKVTQVTIPAVTLGPWQLKNIDIAHCGRCEFLLGKSVLKLFETKTTLRGEIEVLTLTKQKPDSVGFLSK